MTDFEQQIGPFRLYSEVGRTPVATKYRATDSRDGQTVALYILNPDVAQQPTAVQQFLTVGRQAIRLRHPNIVSVLEADQWREFAYITTQWIGVPSIGERLRRSGRTADIETAIHLVKGVAAALDYAHSEGFIHGHLTLNQLYITDDNSVLLDGFAQAGQVDALPVASDEEQSVPTAPFHPPLFISPFLAPEQARSGQTTDLRADVYSLGAVLYTILLGRPPFVAEEADELLNQIIEKLPPPPETINPALPAAMAYVLKSVLAKDPAIRYGSASELANAFQQSNQWRSIPHQQSLPEFPLSRLQSVRPRRRRRGLGIILLFLITALLGIVIISSIGIGPLGEQFAFVRQTEGAGRLIAQVRTLFLPQPAVVVELTANPAALTPVVMVTMTPPTTTISSQIAAQVPTITDIATSSTITPMDLVTATPRSALTVTTIAFATATPSPTATVQPATATETATRAVTVTLSPTSMLTQSPTRRSTVETSNTGPALEIDPLGLLTGPVTAGTVVINGNAPPGAQVQLQINGRSGGSSIVKATGTWALIVSVAQPGDYEIVAQVLDTDGKVVETAQHTLTVVDAEETVTATETVQSTATPSRTTAATVTATQVATVTAKATNTVTPTASVTPSATPTPLPSVTATPTATVMPTTPVQPTAPDTPTVTNTVQPTATVTRTPTVTHTNTPQPTATATVTNTPAPTVTRTNTPRPTATVTNTSLPTATATVTNTPAPTVTHTNTPRPTATVTNTSLPTATATVTNTPTPTVTRTNTPRPTATMTNTSRPTAPATATNTSMPTATATNTPAPTATNTPVPTATNTLVPTATNTRPPTATYTPAPTATPTAVTGSIEPISPGNGESSSGQRLFSWSANFTPSAGYAFELVFWEPGRDPLTQSFGMAAPTTNLSVNVDLERLDEQLGELFDIGEYEWGVLLVRTTPAYERVQYLGGGRRFSYSSGGDPGSGGPSSGE